MFSVMMVPENMELWKEFQGAVIGEKNVGTYSC